MKSVQKKHLNMSDALTTTIPVNITKALKAVILEAEEKENKISPNNKRVISKDGLFRAYLYENEKGEFCAAGYIKRSKKTAFRYRYRDRKHRASSLEEWFKVNMQREEDQKERNKRLLEVGDVLYASWGYEQTNVSFYLVTKLIGSTSVEIVPIGKKENYSCSFSGVCVPEVKKIRGERIRKVAKGNYVNISSYIQATKLEYKEVDGVKIYREVSFSSYY